MGFSFNNAVTSNTVGVLPVFDDIPSCKCYLHMERDPEIHHHTLFFIREIVEMPHNFFHRSPFCPEDEDVGA